MERQKAKITYLHHSGFTVEMDTCLIVFDYYQGNLKLPDKKTYVLASHMHPDHYNPAIFAWRKERPDIEYILGFDIYDDANIPHERDNITFISPYEEIQVDGLTIKAYGSTDEGVSFLVKCDGTNIFHAGDLNWWYWAGETLEENMLAERGFKEELVKIKGEHIDIAFFPVDPRLEKNYWLGAELFIDEIHPHYFIPMHFWDDHKLIKLFKDKEKASSTQVIILTQRGQEIII